MTKFKAVTNVTYQDHDTIEEFLETEGVTNAVAIARANARQAASANTPLPFTTFVLGDTVVTKVES